MVARQKYEVRFHAQQKPGKVTVNGVAQETTWDVAVRVATVVVPAAAGDVKVQFAE